MFYNEVNFNLFLIDENVCIAIDYCPFCAFIVVDVTSNCRFYVYHPIVLISCWTYANPSLLSLTQQDDKYNIRCVLYYVLYV
jgi:hypothetical protein